MSKRTSEIQILLHTKDPSKRLYVLALALDTHTFFKIKISFPEEIIERSIERGYKKPLKNAYMVFMVDCSDAFKIAKADKKFRQNSECFKDFSSLWNISPKEVKDEYVLVFANYKKLKPIGRDFVHCYSKENVENNNYLNGQMIQSQSESEITLDQDNSNSPIPQLETIQFSNAVVPSNFTQTVQFENSLVIPQLETIQFANLEVPSNFTPQLEVGQFSNSFEASVVILGQDNLPSNYTSQLEAIQFEGSEVILGQNNLPNNTNDQSEAIQLGINVKLLAHLFHKYIYTDVSVYFSFSADIIKGYDYFGQYSYFTPTHDDQFVYQR